MNLLQISPPKTGSFWLHTILKHILYKKKLSLKSYIQHQPVYEQLIHTQLSFKEQAGVDMLDIEEGGNFYRVSSIFREKIRNIQEYASLATLTWTHSTYCSKTPQVFEHFDKKIIIVRDPRDRALSVSRFAFTPYMQQYYPSSYTSPEEYLKDEYERLLEQWVWFYGNYLLHREELNLHFIFYERLLQDFQSEFDDLLKYLNISLGASEKAEIERMVSFFNMKEKNPQHLEKGKRQKWIAQLSRNQQRIAAEKAGFLMELFGYPLAASWVDMLPDSPQVFEKDELLNRLKMIDWKRLHGSALNKSDGKSLLK